MSILGVGKRLKKRMKKQIRCKELFGGKIYILYILIHRDSEVKAGERRSELFHKNDVSHGNIIALRWNIAPAGIIYVYNITILDMYTKKNGILLVHSIGSVTVCQNEKVSGREWRHRQHHRVVANGSRWLDGSLTRWLGGIEEQQQSGSCTIRWWKHPLPLCPCAPWPLLAHSAFSLLFVSC